MSKMTAGILKLDEIPAHVLLMVNMAIAGFVGLAHGGALATTLIQESGNLGEILPMVGVSLPIATVILISSIVVLISKKWLMPVLSIHSVMLCCGSIAALVWTSGILLNGIPEGNFVWSPGMMTFICVYPFYLLRISLLRKYMTRLTVVRYLHVLVFVIALAMDLGVFFNFKSSIKSRRESFFDSSLVGSDSDNYSWFEKLTMNTFSGGYFDYSPNERYVVDVAHVEKRRWGELIEEYYQVRAIVGKDYRSAKAFSVERISVEEAGAVVELDHDDVSWSIKENKVSVKVGKKLVDIELVYAPPNPRVIRTIHFDYISQIPESLDDDFLNVKALTLLCDGTNDFNFTDNHSFYVRPEPGGITELSYYSNPCFFFDFGKSSIDEIKATLSQRQLKQMKVHSDIALEDGHVYFFVGPKGYDDAPVLWEDRGNCLFRVQFVDD